MSAVGLAIKAGDMLEGRYKIIKPVGEGGMGTVFLAQHVLIGRKVAIKILRPELAADSDAVERFMNEAKAAGAIGHPHIVDTTDMGFTREDVPFIVFEYLEGTVLTEEIYRVKGMLVRRALRIAGQIASALHAAHSAGIIHRDLKSDNFFLTDKDDASDHIKVLDFGISRFLEADAPEDDDAPHRQLVMGTPQFMAPEQILSPAKVDHRADIYALGVVLYEMLTARRPFEFDVNERLLSLHKIVTDPVPPMNRDDLPPGLEALVRDKLLAKDPEERFQSMKDVQGALDAFLGVTRGESGSIALAATGSLTAIPVATPPPAKTSLRWLLAAFVAGAAGTALLLVEPEPATATVATNDAATKALEAAAGAIAATLDNHAQAAHLRAEGIASLPMLRAAIETDAATLADMVKDRDMLFKAQPDETLEVFQVRQDTPASLIRIPATASALTPLAHADTRVDSDGTHVRVVVSAPVTNQRGVEEGIVVLSTPFDLAAITATIAPHTKAAALTGLAAPVLLVGTEPPATPMSFAIETNAQTRLAGLALAADVVAPPGIAAAPSPAFAYARHACWGLAGLLLVGFAASRARHTSAA